MWDINSLRMRKELVHLNKRFKKTDKEYFSMRKILREEGKSNENFEAMISQMTLEELIALKLELSVAASRGKFFGIPLWSNFNLIIKDALMRFALSICTTSKQASAFLGMSIDDVFSKVFHWDEQNLKKSLEELPDYASPLKILLHERRKMKEGVEVPPNEPKNWVLSTNLPESNKELLDAKVEIMKKERSWEISPPSSIDSQE